MAKLETAPFPVENPELLQAQQLRATLIKRRDRLNTRIDNLFVARGMFVDNFSRVEPR